MPLKVAAGVSEVTQAQYKCELVGFSTEMSVDDAPCELPDRTAGACSPGVPAVFSSPGQPLEPHSDTSLNYVVVYLGIWGKGHYDVSSFSVLI